MQYKISEKPLKLKEFGRNIQMMIEEAKKIEDDEERNFLVNEIIRMMGNINPNIKDSPDYRQALWDNFYFLAEFDIDIDSEYEIPSPESFHSKPSKRMEYTKGRPRFRHYGKNVDLMIDQASKMEEGEEKDELVNLIANIMRLNLKLDNRDSNVEMTVIEQMKSMSRGALNPVLENLYFFKLPNIQPQQRTKPSNKKRKKRKK